MYNRIEKIRAILEKRQLDALLVSSVSNIFYLTQFSEFSSEEREAYLLISKDKQYIFTDGRYKEAVETDIPNFQLQLITPQTPFVTLLKNICEKEKLDQVGFEENNITFWEYQRIQQTPMELSPLSLHIRMYKDDTEIAAIQKACDLGDKTFAYVLHKIKEGITEKELQIEIELYIKKQGADISFRPIVAFGANASMPHYVSSDKRKLKPNECILIDMGTKVDGYCSDMTRTVFFGKPTEEQTKVYETVLTSQQKAIDYINKRLNTNSTILSKNVDNIARGYINSQSYPSIPHSLGHGTGIDVHEPPSLNPTSEMQLQNGMVFSIEPGIYLPKSIGVRIEDLVAIQNNELTILTLSPKELIVL